MAFSSFTMDCTKVRCSGNTVHLFYNSPNLLMINSEVYHKKKLFQFFLELNKYIMVDTTTVSEKERGKKKYFKSYLAWLKVVQIGLELSILAKKDVLVGL